MESAAAPGRVSTNQGDVEAQFLQDFKDLQTQANGELVSSAFDKASSHQVVKQS